VSPPRLPDCRAAEVDPDAETRLERGEQVSGLAADLEDALARRNRQAVDLGVSRR
jgi:hypothetical protein